MILVTGGTGLLGSNLINYLIKLDQKVRVLIRKEKDKKQFKKNKNLSFIIGDVLDVWSLEQAMVDVDYIYHCAGVVSFSPFDKDVLHDVNVKGTSNVVNVALDSNIKKMCHVSSVAAIGKSKDINLITEETVWDPSLENSYYGLTKYLGELEVWRGIEEGLDAVIVNPSIILGYAKWESPSMSLFKYVRDENKYYTDGGNNFVGVYDVCDIMFKLMNSEVISERYIVAGERRTYKDLFTIIADELGVSSPNKLAKKWMLNLLWRLEYIKSILFRTKPLITKETVNISSREHEYSSNKVQDLLNYSLSPVSKVIREVCLKIKNN